MDPAEPSQGGGVCGCVVVVLEFRRAEGRLKHVEELRCSSVNGSWDTICCGRAAKHQTGRRNLGGGRKLVESASQKRTDENTKEKIYINSKKARDQKRRANGHRKLINDRREPKAHPQGSWRWDVAAAAKGLWFGR